MIAPAGLRPPHPAERPVARSLLTLTAILALLLPVLLLPVLLVPVLLPSVPAPMPLVGPGSARAATTDTAIPPAAPAATVAPSVPAFGRNQALPLEITIDRLEPRAPRPADVLTLSGSVRNTTGTAATDVHVRLRVSSVPLSSRTRLAAFGSASGSFGHTVPDSEIPVASALPAGATVRFSLRAPVSALELRRSGVYPFGIEARTHGEDGATVAGRTRTPLPLVGGELDLSRTPVGWVWPLTSGPIQLGAGDGPPAALADDVGPNGRLRTLLTAAQTFTTSGRAAPLTLAVDPALLDAIGKLAAQERSTGGQTGVGGEGGTGSAGASRTRPASAWLDDLRSAKDGRAIFALPYGDPDLVALTRAGMDRDIGQAVRLGQDVFRGALGSDPVTGLIWPADGLINEQTVDALAGLPLAADTLVLSGRSIAPQGSLNYTPGAAAEVRGSRVALRAVVSDATLDAVVAAGAEPDAAGVSRLAEQRFLAETYLRALERPSTPRPLLITPPRDWNPAPAFAAGLLRDTVTVPWLRPALVPELAGAAPAQSGSLVYPASATDQELPGRYLSEVRTFRAGVDQVHDVVVDPSFEPATALDRVLFRLESSALRGRAAARSDALEVASGRLQELKGKVRVATSGRVTLTSRSGRIPVTVANDMNTAVVIQLRLESKRLKSSRLPVQRIEAGEQRQFEVDYEFRSDGLFPVEASLFTPGGELYTPPVRILLRSTEAGSLARGITGGAFAVLLIAVAVRMARRIWSVTSRSTP